MQHILSGCSALAQTKYLQRHNNAFKILFFEVLRSLDLITKVEPWFSQVTPKPLYENEHATAFWDVPLFAIIILLTYLRRSHNLMDSYYEQWFLTYEHFYFIIKTSIKLVGPSFFSFIFL